MKEGGAGVVFLLIAAAQACGQCVIREVPADEVGSGVTANGPIAVSHDANGDGTADVVVGRDLLSGTDMSVLSPGLPFGPNGVPTLVIKTPQTVSGYSTIDLDANTGTVRVRDVMSQALVRTWTNLAESVAVARPLGRDFDGDGSEDVVFTLSDAGEIRTQIRSVATGSVLVQFLSVPGYVARLQACVDDIDGDARPEPVFEILQEAGGGIRTYGILGSRTASFIRTFRLVGLRVDGATTRDVGPIVGMQSIADLDGDGVGELLVVQRTNGGNISAFAMNPASLQPVWVRSALNGIQWPNTAAPADDVTFHIAEFDGDGCPDLLFGAIGCTTTWGAASADGGWGRFVILSGRSGTPLVDAARPLFNCVPNQQSSSRGISMHLVPRTDGRRALLLTRMRTFRFDPFHELEVLRLHEFSTADVAAIGGAGLPDFALTGDDFVSYINAFAAEEPLADVVAIGGIQPRDGLITGDDFNAFIAAFASGCP